MTPASAILLGCVLVVLGIPMIRQWVPRSRIDRWMPGLSVSDHVWYESHRHSGWDFVLMGIGLILLTMWIAPSPDASSDVRDFLGICTVVALLV
ncbi:MAG: hypothetical protein AB7P22_16645, partial [Vicinamibacterales bacterium]